MRCLRYKQKLPLSVEESWSFFSSPTNLKLLTPEHLGFEITTEHQMSEMYAGQIISYIIRPIWNIPIEWVSEIAHVQEPHYFIDVQRFGPYKFWHHEHRFNPIPNGVEMVDTIFYKMPFGIFGKALNALKVKHELETIFAYRHAKLEQMFGPYQT
jgi:ligand-binding SRPBCC domain-containing protein